MLVTTHGTGRDAAARLPRGMVVAGKTGTSSDTRDSWFAGFTGSYLAVVWVGYDDNRDTGLTGAAGALPVWADTMASLKPAVLRTRAAGTRRGSLDRIRRRTRDDAGLQRGRRGHRGAEGHACCRAIPAAAPRHRSPTVGDKIKAWFKSIVH